jgi:hypothetical protein
MRWTRDPFTPLLTKFTGTFTFVGFIPSGRPRCFFTVDTNLAYLFKTTLRMVSVPLFRALLERCRSPSKFNTELKDTDDIQLLLHKTSSKTLLSISIYFLCHLLFFVKGRISWEKEKTTRRSRTR